jgi:hypothetical protein
MVIVPMDCIEEACCALMDCAAKAPKETIERRLKAATVVLIFMIIFLFFILPQYFDLRFNDDILLVTAV